MSVAAAIGLDLGGSHLGGAAVDRSGGILAAHERRIGDLDPEAVLADMAALVAELCAAAKLDRSDLIGVGLGVPGPLDLRAGTILRAINLPGWLRFPVRERLGERVGLRVVLDNDANAAAYGEHWVGVGKGERDLVLLTLGTGVGAGIVLDGHVLHGHFENAGELGHWIVVPEGLPCGCGQRGCLEQYASANAVTARVLSAIADGEPSVLAKAVQGGAAIRTEDVVEAARSEDSLCLRVWEEACMHLAVACINIQHAFNVQRVVLGGGMAGAGGFLLKKVTAHATRLQWTVHNDTPRICLAALGSGAGAIGAAGLAWSTCG